MCECVLRPTPVLEGKGAERFWKELNREKSPGEIVRHNKHLEECRGVYNQLTNKEKEAKDDED